MSATGRHRGSGAAGMAVVLLAVLGWWWFGGNGPMTPLTNSERLAPRDVAATPTSTASPSPQQPLPHTVQVSAFELRDPRHLALTLTAGTPACVGRLRTPEVVETDVSVTVTLRVDPRDRPSEPCGDRARLDRVTVALDVPLGDRSVLDGSLPHAQRVPPAA